MAARLKIPLRTFIELHERAEFPIDSFYIQFQNYEWLNDFFVECFKKLRKQGTADYNEPSTNDPILSRNSRWGPEIEALSYLLTKALGYKELRLKSTLEGKLGVPLSVIHYLVRNCGVSIEKIEGQIDYIYLGKSGKKGPNPSFSIIVILHNSPKAMAPHNVSRAYFSAVGSELSPSKIGDYLKELVVRNYLSRQGPKGAPYFTLRGEEEKFSHK